MKSNFYVDSLFNNQFNTTRCLILPVKLLYYIEFFLVRHIFVSMIGHEVFSSSRSQKTAHIDSNKFFLLRIVGWNRNTLLITDEFMYSLCSS